jgi:hypothetical protein
VSPLVERFTIVCRSAIQVALRHLVTAFHNASIRNHPRAITLVFLASEHIEKTQGHPTQARLSIPKSLFNRVQHCNLKKLLVGLTKK